MITPSRRGFLAGSLGAFAAGRSFGAEPTTLPSVLTTQPAAAKEPPDPGATDEAAYQPTTLFLTWQGDPTTTMTIQWIGTIGETSDTKIYYTAGSVGPWHVQPPLMRPYPMTDLKVFRAELTGLTPGTNYQFKIGRMSPVYRFRTMPSKATDSIHFISGGDCGTNAHAVANNIQAARQDPMFAIIGGDVAYENGKSVETSLAFLRNYSRTMIGRENRMIPLLACLGNHEVDGGYGKARTKAPFFFALFDGLFRDTSYASLDFGDYLSILLLDSGHISDIGGEQASWLEQTLKERADHPNVFAVNHVPAYPSFRKKDNTVGKPGEEPKGGTGVDNRKYWTPLFDKYRVPVVLEHHDHTFKRTKKLIDGMQDDNGVLYLGDGSWGRIRSPQSPEKLSYLASASRDYHLSLHCLQGQERFHLALDEFGRVMDVGHSGQRKMGLVSVPRESNIR